MGDLNAMIVSSAARSAKQRISRDDIAASIIRRNFDRFPSELDKVEFIKLTFKVEKTFPASTPLDKVEEWFSQFLKNPNTPIGQREFKDNTPLRAKRDAALLWVQKYQAVIFDSVSTDFQKWNTLNRGLNAEMGLYANNLLVQGITVSGETYYSKMLMYFGDETAISNFIQVHVVNLRKLLADGETKRAWTTFSGNWDEKAIVNRVTIDSFMGNAIITVTGQPTDAQVIDEMATADIKTLNTVSYGVSLKIAHVPHLGKIYTNSHVRQRGTIDGMWLRILNGYINAMSVDLFNPKGIKFDKIAAGTTTQAVNAGVEEVLRPLRNFIRVFRIKKFGGNQNNGKILFGESDGAAIRF